MSTNFRAVDVAQLREWQPDYRPDEGVRYTIATRDGEVVELAWPELIYLMRGLRGKDTDTVLVFAGYRPNRRQADRRHRLPRGSAHGQGRRQAHRVSQR